MFVSLVKTVGATALLATLTALGATTAVAAEPTIPVKVDLSGVQIFDGPIYISVQKREHYQGMKGYGAVLKVVTPGNMTSIIKVEEPGDYAVSIWHDLDDDGVFSMDENYSPLDGYGSSGNAPDNRRPVFDDVKIKVESFGATVPVQVTYPS